MIGAADARCSPLSGSGRDPCCTFPPRPAFDTPTSAPVAVLFLRAVAGERQGICTSARKLPRSITRTSLPAAFPPVPSMRGVAALPLAAPNSSPPCRQLQQPVSHLCGPSPQLSGRSYSQLYRGRRCLQKRGSRPGQPPRKSAPDSQAVQFLSISSLNIIIRGSAHLSTQNAP
jgi:hypothetical protein